MVRLFAISMGILLSLSAVNAHPFHASTTEIEWNGESQRFEVAMKLRIVDLEDAVSRQQGSRFRIEHSSNVRPLLQQYLQKHFAITRGSDQETHLHWVGYELELHDVWIYFEAESVAYDTNASERPAENVKKKKPLTWDDLLARSAVSDVSTPRTVVRIRNSVLTDIQPEQENLVVLTHGRHVLSAMLTAAQAEQVLNPD
ncbi:MAG: DUF6702 family protein [Planctomycetaceae bacterium]